MGLRFKGRRGRRHRPPNFPASKTKPLYFFKKNSKMSLDLKLWLQVRQPLVEDPHDHCRSVKAVSLSFLFYVVIVRIREIPARNSAHDPPPPYRIPQKIGGKKKTNSPCQHPISLSRWLPLCPGQRDGERENPFGRP